MNSCRLSIRPFFVLLCLLFSMAFAASLEGGATPVNLAIGAGLGVVFALLLFASEILFKNADLKTFNTAVLGVFFGYIMGEGILTVFQTAISLSSLQLSPAAMGFASSSIFLLSIYVAIHLTSRAADELHISVPFVRFRPEQQKKKDILLDASVLLDPRLIDLAASGLLDQHLIVPRFIVKDLNDSLESGDEQSKAKARRGLEVLKKLDNIPSLELRYIDTDFSDIKDGTAKLIRLGRMNDANIFTADMNRVEQSAHEGIKIINIHSLSNALKPITQTGEHISIKIQRYGKEPRQGVGYLDDGTMVVINGGAEYIGECIKAQVLSVKHTSSGRMIFCNATEDGAAPDDELEHALSGLASSDKNYFSL